MIVTTEAVLLRSHPYGESSLVLRFLTPELGAVRAMARGVRRGGGKGAAPPATFDRGRLELSYRENRELQSSRCFTVEIPGRTLAADVVRFAGASLLAEIILAAPTEEPSPELYRAVADALDRIAGGGREAIPGEIVAGGWGILGVLGFSPSVEECVRCGTPLDGGSMARFDPTAGGLRCPACGSDAAGPRVGPGGRRDLAALVGGEVPASLRRPTAHLRLLEAFAASHLELRRPLRSAPMLRDFFRAAEGA